MYQITKHKSYCKMQTDRVESEEVVRKEKKRKERNVPVHVR